MHICEDILDSSASFVCFIAHWSLSRLALSINTYRTELTDPYTTHLFYQYMMRLSLTIPHRIAWLSSQILTYPHSYSGRSFHCRSCHSTDVRWICIKWHSSYMITTIIRFKSYWITVWKSFSLEWNMISISRSSLKMRFEHISRNNWWDNQVQLQL